MSGKKIIIIIVMFLSGVAATAGLRTFNSKETKDIENATKISGGMTVGSFLKDGQGDRAIYTGSISAVWTGPDGEAVRMEAVYDPESEQVIFENAQPGDYVIADR
jgi:hypothetical protein